MDDFRFHNSIDSLEGIKIIRKSIYKFLRLFERCCCKFSIVGEKITNDTSCEKNLSLETLVVKKFAACTQLNFNTCVNITVGILANYREE